MAQKLEGLQSSAGDQAKDLEAKLQGAEARAKELEEALQARTRELSSAESEAASLKAELEALRKEMDEALQKVSCPPPPSFYPPPPPLLLLLPRSPLLRWTRDRPALLSTHRQRKGARPSSTSSPRRRQTRWEAAWCVVPLSQRLRIHLLQPVATLASFLSCLSFCSLRCCCCCRPCGSSSCETR